MESRYPGAGFREVAESDYREALALAEAVVSWAEGQLKRTGSTL